MSSEQELRVFDNHPRSVVYTTCQYKFQLHYDVEYIKVFFKNTSLVCLYAMSVCERRKLRYNVMACNRANLLMRQQNSRTPRKIVDLQCLSSFQPARGFKFHKSLYYETFMKACLIEHQPKPLLNFTCFWVLTQQPRTGRCSERQPPTPPAPIKGPMTL